ncbi:MAG TPA: tetratricopeptide repeat protein [Ilumatobacter sp.]|nr:tetratricopeptide repeat protein [Ilumatobacter sp.]
MGHESDRGGNGRAAPALRPVADRPPGPFPATLPDRIALAGRAGDVERVLAAVDAGRRLVTITGPGGVGKTRLATEVGHQLSAGAPGTVLFVPLTFVTEANGVADAIATAAGWELADQPSPVVQLADRLGEQPTVVVLDNCEQIDALGSIAAELLAAWPAATLLATSRRPLGLAIEQIIDVEPLPLPRPADPWREIAANPAVTALVTTVARRVPGYAVTRSNAGALAELCVRLDGLPLALELAATRLHLVSPAELLELLGRRFAVLHAGSASTTTDGNPHHRRLWATIDWSYQLLDPDVRRQFRHLATFADGFTLDAAAQVLAIDTITALDTITVLTDHHLVRPIGERAGTSRFDMLESIREFAQAELETLGELDRAHAAHAGWATETAQRLHAEINTAEQERVVATFDAERANLRAALRWQLDRGDREALRLAHGQWMYWLIRGAAREGLAWLHAALEMAGPDTDQAVATALMAAGNLHDSRGELRHAAELHERAVAAFAELGDRYRMAASWHTLAAIARELGDLDRAAELQHDALVVQHELGNQREQAVALNGLGVIAYRRGDPQHALAYFLRAVDLFESVGDQLGLAHALDRVGLAHYASGDAATAVTWHRRAQAIAQELDDVPNAANAMVNVGEALLAAGDVDAAADTHDEVARVTAQIGDTRLGIYAIRLGARIADHRGQIGVAVGEHVRTLKRFLEHGYALESTESIEQVAVLAHELGATDLAAACLTAAAIGRAATGTAAHENITSLADELGAMPAPDGAERPEVSEFTTAAHALLGDLTACATEHAAVARGRPPPMSCATPASHHARSKWPGCSWLGGPTRRSPRSCSSPCEPPVRTCRRCCASSVSAPVATSPTGSPN